MVLFSIIYEGHTPLASWKSRGFGEIHERVEGGVSSLRLGATGGDKNKGMSE